MAALLVVVVGVFVSNLLKPAEPGYLRKIVWEIVFPVELLVKSSFRHLVHTWERYIFLVGVKEENLRLTKLNESLSRQVEGAEIQNRELALLAERLKKLLNLKDKLRYGMVGAQVIASHKSSKARFIMIDRGSNQGLKAGMPVLGDQGIVGRVTETSWNVSRVMLTTDHLSRVDIILQEGRLQGVLYGAGRENGYLRYVVGNEEVLVNSPVITSGLCGVFPKGLLAGYVIEAMKAGKDMFQEILVRPAVDFARLEEVLVLTTQVTRK